MKVLCARDLELAQLELGQRRYHEIGNARLLPVMCPDLDQGPPLRVGTLRASGRRTISTALQSLGLY